MAAHPLIFAQSAWFWALPVIVLIGIGLWYLSRFHTYRRVVRFFSVKTGSSVLQAIDWKNKRLRFVVTGVILFLFAIALTRPLTGPKSDQGERKGADLVILLDVSKSMWVEDVEPNRLEAVKKALVEWINKQKSDRIGLILFAGDAFVQAPLTFDYNALTFVLKDAGPHSISKKGSNLSGAIETGVEMLNQNEVESKIILIVSDGEAEGDTITAARTAHQRDGVTIFTVGIGTPSGGKVPSFNKWKFDKPPPNTGWFVRNEFGAEVVSRLESQTLRTIASAGGGSYHELKPGESTFAILRERSLMPLVEKNRKIEAKDYDEWFQIPLAFAILALMLEPLAFRRRTDQADRKTGVPIVQPTTHSRRPRSRPKSPPVKVAVGALLSLWMLLAAIPSVQAREDYMKQVDQWLESGNNTKAEQFMRELSGKNPEDPYIIYNLAVILYRIGKPDEAAPRFEAVQGLSQDSGLRARAAFQMGNMHLETALKLKNTQNAGLNQVRALESALSYYGIQMNIGSNQQSKNNNKLASKELETVLLEIGRERTRANSLKTLNEALQAYERASELNKEHEPLVSQAKERLALMLAESAASLDKEADTLEAKNIPADKEGDQALQGILDRRQTSLGRLQEAAGHAPKNTDIASAISKQQEKLSNLLTRMARREAGHLLEKKQSFYSNNNFKSLSDATAKTDQALSLNPENTQARELQEQIQKARVDAHTTNGELALKHFRKTSDVEGKLSKAQEVVKEFNHVLALDPDNEKANAGLAEVQPVLADLYATVGIEDLEQAKDQLGNSGASPSPESGEGKKPASDPGGAESVQTTEASSSTSSASESALRKSVATLEKSIDNLNSAVSLKPEDAGHQQALKEAESLIGNVRNQLAKLDAAKSAGKSADGKGAGESQGQEGAGEDEGGNPKEGPGGSSMKSMSALRGKAGAGGAGGGDSQRYWEKYARDW